MLNMFFSTLTWGNTCIYLHTNTWQNMKMYFPSNKPSLPVWWCPSPNASSLLSWWETSSCQAPFLGSFSQYISRRIGTKPQSYYCKTAKEKTVNKSNRFFFLTTKGASTCDCVEGMIYIVTHLNSFNEDIIHFVLSACKVGNGNLFAGSDASPRWNCPFHLLDFGFLILVAILQPVTKMSKTQLQWSDSFL